LHATGHLTGIGHHSPYTRGLDSGFLSPGNLIASDINENDWTFEDIIVRTITNHKYIIDAINNRFKDDSSYSE